MSRFREMSYEEISSELGISVNTVKYHIKSALVILKKELGAFLCIIFAYYPTLL
jgi:RNA polymerase sigma-70 factor (ECF subfamily)